MAHDDELFGVADVARELGLNEGDVRAWCRHDGAVPRVGSVWVLRPEDVDRLEADIDDECEPFVANGDDADDDDADDDDADDDDADDDDADDDDADDDDADDDDADDDP